jgi:hypothetical protein
MELLIILATIYLANKVSITIYDYFKQIRQQYKQQQLKKKLIANHPEMKGIALDNGDLLFFASDKEFRSLVMNNDEPGDNTAIEDNDKFNIVVVDYDDEEFE